MDELFPICRTSRSIRRNAAATGRASATAAPALPPRASTATSGSRRTKTKKNFLERLARGQCRRIPRTKLFIPLRQRLTQKLVHLFNASAIHGLHLNKVLSLSDRRSEIRIEVK